MDYWYHNKVTVNLLYLETVFLIICDNALTSAQLYFLVAICLLTCFYTMIYVRWQDRITHHCLQDVDWNSAHRFYNSCISLQYSYLQPFSAFLQFGKVIQAPFFRLWFCLAKKIKIKFLRNNAFPSLSQRKQRFNLVHAYLAAVLHSGNAYSASRNSLLQKTPQAKSLEALP